MPIGTGATTKPAEVVPFWCQNPKDMIDCIDQVGQIGYTEGNISYDMDANGVRVVTLTIVNPDLDAMTGRRTYVLHLDEVLVFDPNTGALTQMSKARYDMTHDGTVWQ